MSNDPLYDILVKGDSDSRKMAPVHAGFFRYFPRAIKACAYLSWMGNQKHNPGEELGWSWNRSDDHGDCVGRHQLDLGTLDEYNLPHELAVAWRGMAQLEKYLVETYDLELPPAAYLVPDDLSEESAESWSKTPGLFDIELYDVNIYRDREAAEHEWRQYIDELDAEEDF